MRVMATTFPGLLARPLLNVPCHSREDGCLQSAVIASVSEAIQCKSLNSLDRHVALWAPRDDKIEFITKIRNIFSNLLTRTTQYAYPLAQLANLAFPISMMAATLATTGVLSLPETFTAGANFFMTGSVEESDSALGPIDRLDEFWEKIDAAKEAVLNILGPQMEEARQQKDYERTLEMAVNLTSSGKTLDPAYLQKKRDNYSVQFMIESGITISAAQTKQLKEVISFLAESDIFEVFRAAIAGFEELIFNKLLPTSVRAADSEEQANQFADLFSRAQAQFPTPSQIGSDPNLGLLTIIAEKTGPINNPIAEKWKGLQIDAYGVAHDTGHLLRDLVSFMPEQTGKDQTFRYIVKKDLSELSTAIMEAEYILVRAAKNHGIKLDITGWGGFNQQLPQHMRTSFFRIMYELATNAMKHSKKDVVIRFEQEGSLVRMFVEDKGPGIADPEAVWSGKCPDGTTGLGLRTARELADKNIWKLVLYKTEVGVGSTFMLEMDTGGWK